MGVFATLVKKLLGEPGPSGQVDLRQRLASLPLRYAQFDLTLAWQVTVTGRETSVDGVVKNLRYAHMDGVEIWITAVDAEGATLARGNCFVIPHLLRQDDLAAFAVRLPVPLSPGTLLKFGYKYRGTDGGEGGTSWMQSFDSHVPAP
jgi:hypothetical protein